MKIPKINTPDGLFHDGDHVAGVEGTIVTAAWLNAVQKAFKDIGLEKVTKSGDSMTGMLKAPGVNFDNEMLISNYNLATTSGGDWKTSENIDGIWHDDSTNTFHLQSDATYKSKGNATLQLGGLLIGDKNADERYLLASLKSNAIDSSSKKTVATSYAVKAAKDAADAIHVDYVDDLNNVSDVGFCAFRFSEKSLNNNLADAAPGIASSTYDAVGFQIKKIGQTTQFLSTGGYHFVRDLDSGSNWSVQELLTSRKITTSVHDTGASTVPSSRVLNGVYKKARDAQSLAEKLALVGVPIPYPKASPPQGYVVMKGQKINKSKYPKLFEIYGARLPDLRAEVIRGWDNGRGIDAGRTLLSHQDDALASHSHEIKNSTNGGSTIGVFHFGDTGTQSADQPSNITESFGGSETRMKNTAYNYVCLLG
ncbi:MAG: tail fiber protein [Gammaproteobacteria bacterium]|nr:tail fiber protein [Gammaproteobacteria bacterium]